MVKKAITIWAYENGVQGDYDLRQVIPKAIKDGFEAIELSFSLEGTISFETNTEELKYNYEKWKESGIEFSSISTLLFHEINLCMERDRIFAVSLLKQMIYLASILGISTISIPAGYLKKNEKYWDLFHGLIWVVDQIKDYAEEKSIFVCVENTWDSLFNSPIDVLYFKEKISCNSVGMCFDIGNTIITGFPQHWLDVLDSYIRKIHFTDIHKRKSGILEFVFPGEGNVDYEILKKYSSIKTVEYITVEAFYSRIHKDENWYIKCAKQLEKLQKSIWEV